LRREEVGLRAASFFNFPKRNTTMQRNDPRLRRLALGALLAGSLAIPALAQQADFGPRAPGSVAVTSDSTYVAPGATYVSPAPAYAAPEVAQRVEPTSAIHAGANNAVDQALAERVADAIADEPRLDGITVTVAANNGNVSLAGSAESPEQAAIAEQVAREVAGPGSVSGTLSPTGG
jgi:osmotically-inducible protein OsmY